MYLYRAVDSHGQTIDFLLSAKRDADAAKRFFRKALAQPHTVRKTLEFANTRSTVAGPNAISRFTLNGDVDIDGKVRSASIGVMTVWQKQGDDWRLLAGQGFKPEA
jgi:hypothetical protein